MLVGRPISFFIICGPLDDPPPLFEGPSAIAIMSSASTEQDLMKAKLLVPEEKLKKALYAFNMYSKQLVDAEVSSQDLESAFKKAELELLSQRDTIDGYLVRMAWSVTRTVI